MVEAPNWKRWLAWFAGTVVVCTLGWLTLCAMIAMPIPEDAQTLGSAGLSPWWRQWEFGAFVGAILGMLTGVMGAFDRFHWWPGRGNQQ